MLVVWTRRAQQFHSILAAKSSSAIRRPARYGFMLLPARRRSGNDWMSTIGHTYPVQAHDHGVRLLGRVLGREGKHLQRKKQSGPFLRRRLVLPGPLRAKLDVVDMSFFEQWLKPSQAFSVKFLVRAEGVPLINLDQRLKALHASQSSSSCRWTKHQPGRLPPSRTALLLGEF